MGEATVVINGVTLTIVQSMMLRMAVTSFLMHMQEVGLGNDEHGKAMAEAYILRASEV